MLKDLEMFLYGKNNQYKTIDLHFFDKQHDKKYPAIDLLSFDCSKVSIDDEYKLYYDDKPCNVSIEKIAATIVKGHHLISKTFQQFVSVGLSDLVWKIFIKIINLINKKTKKLNFFVDSILVNISCDQKLPLNKITYFYDIVVRFDRLNEVIYRVKQRYHVNAYVCKSKIILSA